MTKLPSQLPFSRSLVDAKSAAVTVEPATGPAAARYQAEIKKMQGGAGKGLASLCVVDSSGPGRPIVAGWNIDEPMQVASMAKLALLLASGQLRDDVQLITRWAGLTKWRDVAPAVRAVWAKSKSAEFRALATGLPTQLPQFDVIFDGERFDAGADAVPELRSAWPTVQRHGRLIGAHYRDLVVVHTYPRPDPVDPKLQTSNPKEYDRLTNQRRAAFTSLYDDILAKVPFAELMQLTIKWSDNEAASACLSRLGLPYVWAVLRQTGLYDDKKQAGLWLGGLYRPLFDSKVFRSPGQTKPVRIGSAAAATDDEAHPAQNATSTQVGTARQCSTLLAALDQGVLFQYSSQWAIDLLEFRVGQVVSGILPANFYLFLRYVQGDFTQTLMMLSKIGILGSVYSEAALLAHLPKEASPPDGGRPGPDPNQLAGRSLIVTALQAKGSDTLTALGSALVEVSDRLGG